MKDDANHPIYTMPFARVYPLYVQKAQRKGRTKKEVDAIIRWFTGYTPKGLESLLAKGSDFQTFLAKAPRLNPARTLITGVVCGVRVEDIQHPTMREIRYLDKLIDELAKGKAMESILRAFPLGRPIMSMPGTTVKRQKDAPAKSADAPKRKAARPNTGIKTSRIEKARTRKALEPAKPVKPGARKSVHDVEGRPHGDVRIGRRGRRS